jgi:hypothetical protein
MVHGAIEEVYSIPPKQRYSKTINIVKIQIISMDIAIDFTLKK